jgi:transcriptional regulator with XRE-family HTH domain
VTQAQLAESLGKPQSFVSKFERFERRLDIAEYVRIANAVGLDPDEGCRALGWTGSA